jgi:tetratricopeptide (TPR) repeat protein
MNMRWVYLLAVSLFLTLLFTTTAAAGDAAWVEVKSPHFSVYTDAGERRGREVATRFEQMRVVFGELISNAKVNTPIPLQIVAFRNNKELKQVAPLWHGKPIDLAGLFISGSDRCFILLDLGTENPWSTVFHEYAHQLMNGTISASLDPWFVEGFAEYFSSIEVDSHHANVGKIPPLTYEIIQQQGMMKVADLFRVQHDSATYNETGNKRTVFYAESSMVVHYIYDNGLMLKVAKYFELKYNQNLSVDDAIQQAFGMSAANFHKEIVTYVASNQFKYYPRKTPPEVETTGYSSRPITATDAAATIADIHLHSGDYQAKALTEFEDVLKSEPDNAVANRGMGYTCLQKRDFDKAAEYFRRAAKADPKDAQAHYQSGVLINMKGALDKSDLAFMTSELKAAIALDPDFADSYMQLAYAQARAANVDEAIANAKKAISLNPRNEGYYFNIAELYRQKGKNSEALSIYRALMKSSDPGIASRAASMAEQIGQMEASMKEVETIRGATAQGPTAVPTSRAVADRLVSEGGSPSGVHLSPDPPTPPLPPSPPPSSSMRFLKGTIASVDCASPPGALITVTSAGKHWLMQVRDSHHVLVLGGNGFSCDWKNQKVALNYRETGESSGTVVTIEIQ